jgi:hypothetical protein
MVSEYATGPNRWIFVVCFLALAVGNASLSVALKSQVRTRMGWIGIALLLLSTLLLASAAMLSASPRWTQQEALPSSGLMLGISSMIEVPGGVLGVLLLSLALRKRALWIAMPLLGLAVVAWISFGLMVASPLVASDPLTTDGPGIAGLANRTLIVAYGIWLMSAAWPLARARTHQP